MKELICKECGKSRNIGRRLCNKCNSKRISLLPRYTWTKSCNVCGNTYKAWRKAQETCKVCYDKKLQLASLRLVSNNYLYTKTGKLKHRVLVESLLKRKLSFNDVIHHMDGDPKNNSVNNLILISRSVHGKLHIFLDMQRVILEQSKNENFENCWNTLIAPITTTWLETANVKVIKIWEIGQSAAEHLKDNTSNGEGSETMHETSILEEDIVQTTTGSPG